MYYLYIMNQYVLVCIGMYCLQCVYYAYSVKYLYLPGLYALFEFFYDMYNTCCVYWYVLIVYIYIYIYIYVYGMYCMYMHSLKCMYS